MIMNVINGMRKRDFGNKSILVGTILIVCCLFANLY